MQFCGAGEVLAVLFRSVSKTGQQCTETVSAVFDNLLALANVKTEFSSRLNVESNLKCALGWTPPDINHLVSQKQVQSSY